MAWSIGLVDSLALEGLSLSENDNEEKEDQKEEMVGLGGGPILTRGIKFASSDEFLSFMETEGERSENELVNTDGGGHHNKAELDDQKRSPGIWSFRTRRSLAAFGNALMNPVVELKKMDAKEIQGREPEPTNQERKKSIVDSVKVAEPSAKKGQKKKVEEEDEYEVEEIVGKREKRGQVEYLVKWKGWEEEKDRTWEPLGNLKGSEKLIKKYEVSAGSPPSPTPADAEDGVALCDVCNRIFLSRDSLKNHAKEHKKEKKKSATPSPRSRRNVQNATADKIEDPKKIEKPAESLKRKRSEENKVIIFDCYNCGKDCKNRAELKHHVLSHFYPEFYARLPSSKPFSCPVCANVSRDRISLVRHFAFVHEVDYKQPMHHICEFKKTNQQTFRRSTSIARRSSSPTARAKMKASLSQQMRVTLRR